ncbi:peptidyl-tRNA hydrolase [Thermodesulfatator indicus DSM 15286]|uniref:Peptidyl-tRNA hydrolase n=1 Tax=Thermodesulfatator indicus (strain DSM 15286 / JCM 11887 / CIR29812) TaxID=667014 RepID=F8AAH4_THEID|nr:aminoacyl-tRNA hydrolase [Thermodesulfatator indicus]AEH45394.1 peptidyl-tRNA hydrolase [Thermodesulfatator indicus DSM 15286]
MGKYSWLWVGLGNPGPRYRFTRHNFGFLVLDELASLKGLKFSQGAYQSLVSAYKDAFLVKPQTFMNLSGEAVAPWSRKLKISSERILVIHDDLDLPLGRLKFVPKGGAGGHRGVKSVIDALGTKEFPRLKLGIGRPPQGVTVREYVLSPFSESEIPLVKKVLERAVEALDYLLEHDLPKTMSTFNRPVD